MLPLHMVFLIFIAPRKCFEHFPGGKWENVSIFRVSLRGTLFLYWEAGCLTVMYHAGKLTWGSMGALNLMSVVNSLNLGLNKEFFPTHQNSCPHWQLLLVGSCQDEAPNLCPPGTNTGAAWGEGSPRFVSQLLVNKSGPTCPLSSDADNSSVQLSLPVSKAHLNTCYP